MLEILEVVPWSNDPNLFTGSVSYTLQVSHFD